MSGRAVTWTGPDGKPVTVHARIPDFRKPLTALPPARRVAFTAHLAGIASNGFAGPPPAEIAEDRTEAEAPEPAMVEACCTACGGWCCQGGAARHAYLGVRAALRWRADHPAGSPDAMIRDYLAHLPALSAEGSCVYHGPRGCTLPRRMRADLCNAFHCSGIRALGIGASGEG